MINLASDIANISRVGSATAKKLKKLGIATAGDLLFYFPFRYDDFSQLTPIAELRAGMSANVVGRIELIQNKRSPRRRMNITEALVSDETETLKVIWFNQPFIGRNLKVGDKVSLSGKADEDYGGLVMTSPIYEKIIAGAYQAVHTQGLVPVYHLTANITAKQVRFLIKTILPLAGQIMDWLPAEIKRDLKLLNLAEAIKKIHFPRHKNDIEQARERLAFDELFLVQLRSQLAKQNLKSCRAPSIIFQEQATKDFVSGLPFKLTDAQRRAAWEILRDMAKDQPMARLLEGDVGSGKTMVALIAMLNAVLNHKQAVLMVPTEILARQHYETVNKYLGGYSTVALLTHSQFLISNFQFLNNDKNSNVKISKRFILGNIGNGNIQVIIGTHALIQEDVKFKNLALAVIDEQHRFGVEQRARLTKKGEVGQPPIAPHLLSMTATPIPRSLALAIYGDLDISILNQMPLGRKKIITSIVSETKREAAYQFIREQIKQGRQVFVICPLIDVSDALGVKSAKEEYEKLDKLVFPELTIGMLHGRMKAKDKERVMRDFLDNKIKILVSTAVVEVGVDVANAAIMMIEGADRFGLAQIHQFRGRVGRSDVQSYCFLFTDSDSDKTMKRLQAAVTYNDGFALARMDLKFRGPGEVYGTAQKGFPELKVASLFDYKLMRQAQEQAVKLVAKDGSLNSWPALKRKLGEVVTINY